MSSPLQNIQQIIQIVQPIHSEDQQQNPQPKYSTQQQQHQIKSNQYTSKTQTQSKPSKQQNLSIQQNLNRPKPTDKKRKKIILYKCKICKTTGKKSTVKMCSKCKFHFHIQCIDPEKIIDDTKSFVCELCDKYATTEMKLNLTNSRSRQSPITNLQKDMSKRMSQNIQQQKSTGFLNISKLNSIYQNNFKKEEWKRKLHEFYKKYPYCFQKNKIIFPIEDHLLHIYQSIMPSYCKTTTPRPIPCFPNDGIPQQFYNQLMEIQVFFYHFWQDFKLQNFFRPQSQIETKQIKIEQMKRKNIFDKFNSPGVCQLYAWILETLLRMYLNDIMDRNRIDNIKFIGLSPFFNLLAVISEYQKGLPKQLIIKLAPEIIQNLLKAPSFRHSFQCDYETERHDQFQYPKQLTCQNKIRVIKKLIRGLCDTECFKEIVIKKSQQISFLTKQKGQNLQKLKSIQNENIPLRQKIKQLQNELKQLAFSDPKEYSKKYELGNKKLQKMILTHKQNLEKIEQFREKVKEVGRKMPFVNSEMKFLGVDRYRSEYFFNKNEKSRIYVKYRESFLVQQSSNKEYLCYQMKQEIEKLKSWLNGKGTNEKGLLFNINSLQQKDLIIFEKGEITNDNKSGVNDNNAFKINENNAFKINDNTPIILEQNQSLCDLKTITRQENIQTLIQCEQLYKQTLQNDQIPQRQKQIKEIFQKLAYSTQSNSKITNQQNQSSQHPLHTLFSKYSSKILNWNQKAKRFWYQFLNIYTHQPNHQTQPNLLILVTIWKITLKFHHHQFIKKQQKISKKNKKFNKTITQKQIENNNNQEFQHQKNSENQINSNTQSPQENLITKRKLRKRQNKHKLQEKQESTPDQSNSYSNIKLSSNQSQQEITSSLKSYQKNKFKSKNHQQKSSLKQKKTDKQKINIKLSSSQSQKPEYESQKQLISSSKSLNEQNQLLLAYQQQQVLSKENFCEECFQNINYDKTSKIKVVRCRICPKAYHKKCLDQESSSRLKNTSNDWKCDDCLQKSSFIENKNIKRIKNSRKSQLIKNDQLIVPQTVKVSQKLDFCHNLKKKNINLTEQKHKQKLSKVIQKAEKKERKKKEQEKKSYLQEINSQSLSKSEEELEKHIQIKTRRDGANKNENKSVKSKSLKTEVSKQKNKLQQNLNFSRQPIVRRSTRDLRSRKNIVEFQFSKQAQKYKEQFTEEQLS